MGACPSNLEAWMLVQMIRIFPLLVLVFAKKDVQQLQNPAPDKMSRPAWGLVQVIWKPLEFVSVFATGGVQMVDREVSRVSRVDRVSAGIIAHLAHHVPPALILVGKKIMKNMIVHHTMNNSMKTIVTVKMNIKILMLKLFKL